MASENMVWLDSGKQILDSLKNLGEINYTLANRLAQQQMEAFSIYLEGGVKHLQALSEAQDTKALLNSEATLVDEVGKKLLGNVQGTLEVLDGAKSQWVGWVESNAAKMPKAAA